jgi:hypothetical protein
VYQLAFSAPADGRREAVNLEQRGRLLFDASLSFHEIRRRYGEEPKVRVTQLTDVFSFETLLAEQPGLLPLFIIRGKSLMTFTAHMPPKPRAGDRVVSLTTN